MHQKKVFQTTVCFCASLRINKATFCNFKLQNVEVNTKVYVFATVYFIASINYAEVCLLHLIGDSSSPNVGLHYKRHMQTTKLNEHMDKKILA